MAHVPLYDHRKEHKDVKYSICMFCRVNCHIAKDNGRDQYITNISEGANQLVKASRLVIKRLFLKKNQ